MLIQKRKEAEAKARAILDRAEAENRSLDAEEQRQFDQISADMDVLRQRSDSLVKFDADNRSAEEALGRLGHVEHTHSDVDVTAQFRSLANGEVRHINLMPTKAENRRFTEHRALSKGTATAGGNTVPTSFHGQLIEHLIESATLINAGATVLNTDSGENYDVPVTTAHGAAALVAESGTIPQSDPTFAKRTLGAYKYGLLVLVPRELLEDTGVDMEGYLAKSFGRAVGNALGAHLITGTGTGQPAGITTQTTLGVTSGTAVAGAPTFDNLIDLMYSVNPAYRNSPEAGWLIKDSSVGVLRKIKDTAGRYLWENSTVAGVPDLILGKQVFTDPNMPATGLNAKSVAFGDLSSYWVRIVNGIRFERSDEFKFDTDQVAFRCLIRGDGLLIDQSGAVKHFVGAAT
ncbi:phage major capsid protein [Arthrobacter sp. B3I4]|uniref:phage major capsid protein n=1 Tax=Arthrobacter sp. B3I4 TaxID=3042267 RepID=UPI0027D7C467|nr:phage major capsid protein [Arthrobacter sp. B3I4]